MEEDVNSAAAAPTAAGGVPWDDGGDQGPPPAATAALPARSPPPLAAVNRHAAGLDVGAEAPEGAVPARDDPQPVRRGGAYTVDVERVADGLAACGVTTVALESTGVEGSPRCERVETRGVAVLLVDPPPGPKSTGRPKSAVHAGPWRPRL